jgi:hypothetical protein
MIIPSNNIMTCETIPINNKEKVNTWIVEAGRFKMVDMKIATEVPSIAAVISFIVAGPIMEKA